MSEHQLDSAGGEDDRAARADARQNPVVGNHAATSEDDSGGDRRLSRTAPANGQYALGTDAECCSVEQRGLEARQDPREPHVEQRTARWIQRGVGTSGEVEKIRAVFRADQVVESATQCEKPVSCIPEDILAWNRAGKEGKGHPPAEPEQHQGHRRERDPVLEQAAHALE